MRAALEANAQRRRELVARSTSLRTQFAFHGQVLARPFAAADRVRDAGRWALQRPWVLAVIPAAAAVLRPKKALGWAFRAWGAFRLARQVAAMLKR